MESISSMKMIDGAVLACHDKQLAHHSRALSNELLDQLGARDANEGAFSMVCDCARKQSFACARRTVQKHALGLRNSQGIEQFRVFHRQFNYFLYLLDLLLEAPHHLVC